MFIITGTEDSENLYKENIENEKKYWKRFFKKFRKDLSKDLRGIKDIDWNDTRRLQ